MEVVKSSFWRRFLCKEAKKSGLRPKRGYSTNGCFKGSWYRSSRNFGREGDADNLDDCLG